MSYSSSFCRGEVGSVGAFLPLYSWETKDSLINSVRREETQWQTGSICYYYESLRQEQPLSEHLVFYSMSHQERMHVDDFFNVSDIKFSIRVITKSHFQIDQWGKKST